MGRLGDDRWTSRRVVPEPRTDEVGWVQKVPPIHDQRIRHDLPEGCQLRSAELGPIRPDHERMRPGGGLVYVVREFELGYLLLRAPGGAGIAADHVRTGRQEQPREREGGAE